MIDYTRELNEEQLQVVLEGGGPLLVIAGAGSGKTRTLTYRVARLIEAGVGPERIMLATFTNKAARSMLTRVQTLIGFDIGQLWGGTFHHIAHRILRRNSSLLGYDMHFSIMDEEDAKHLMRTCIAEAGVDTKSDRFPKADVLKDMVSLAANIEAPMYDVIASRYPYFSHRLEDIEAVAALYQRRKKALNAMDFDDLLWNWRRLLLDFPEVLERYAERFSHILVDEYQDTNTIQAHIVDLMASRHRNLMVVGDDSQSIYSFRGANFKNILEFPDRYPDCKIFKLETNYRSTPEILHFANLSIVNNENQFQKSLRAVRNKGVKPTLVSTSNVLQQADFVAQRIIELIRSGVSPEDIAVLYRAHYHSMELQMEMVRRGIPFEIRSGIRFFEQAHIKDVTAYLRIIANPRDELAWKRVLPLYRRVGKMAAEKIWRCVSAQSDPLEFLKSPEFLDCTTRLTRPVLAKFQGVMIKLIARASEAGLTEMMNLVVDEAYRDYLREKYTDASSREDDLFQLAKYAENFHGLEEFLTELALLTNLEKDEVGSSEKQEDKVILSTIHQAKGLEWSVVLMIWCTEGMMPLARALKDPEGEEEERRLFYVATTRAKDQLYLCCPQMDFSRGMGHTAISPSRFIREISPPTYRRKESPYDLWTVDYD